MDLTNYFLLCGIKNKKFFGIISFNMNLLNVIGSQQQQQQKYSAPLISINSISQLNQHHLENLSHNKCNFCSLFVLVLLWGDNEHQVSFLLYIRL